MTWYPATSEASRESRGCGFGSCKWLPVPSIAGSELTPPPPAAPVAEPLEHLRRGIIATDAPPPVHPPLGPVAAAVPGNSRAVGVELLGERSRRVDQTNTRGGRSARRTLLRGCRVRADRHLREQWGEADRLPAHGRRPAGRGATSRQHPF